MPSSCRHPIGCRLLFFRVGDPSLLPSMAIQEIHLFQQEIYVHLQMVDFCHCYVGFPEGTPKWPKVWQFSMLILHDVTKDWWPGHVRVFFVITFLDIEWHRNLTITQNHMPQGPGPRNLLCHISLTNWANVNQIITKKNKTFVFNKSKSPQC